MSDPKHKGFYFLVVAVGLFGLLFAAAAYRQSWFAPTDRYRVELSSADGLKTGTAVMMTGLRAGKITQIELLPGDRVRVEFQILRRYSQLLKRDAQLLVFRPYLVGEKVLSLKSGTASEVLAPGSQLAGEEAMELVDFLRGDRISPYLKSLTDLLEQVQRVTSPKDQGVLKLYGQAFDSLKAIEKIAGELKIIRSELATNAHLQKVITDLSQSSGQMKQLMEGGVTMLPQINKTLGETVFTLQAMQRSFILRGGVERLREEDKKIRAPSSQTVTEP